MFETLRVRFAQGFQAIPDIRKAKIAGKHRGKPLIADKPCIKNCKSCIETCPSGAVTSSPVSIDLGKCVFCGGCEKACPDEIIKFTNEHKISSFQRGDLIADKRTAPGIALTTKASADKSIKKIFGRSLKLRQVSAGGCNACEMELNACSNVNFDMGRFGIEIVASPRHADGLLITGPVTANMALALNDAYLSVPEPKIIILAGACAISGGVFRNSPSLEREFIDKHHIDLFIPGCPVHPLTVINGILDLISSK